MSNQVPFFIRQGAGPMFICKSDCRSCTNPNIPDLQTIKEVKQLLGNRNDHVGLDLGAHVGLYGIALNKYFKQMVSFEPAEVSYRALDLNSKIYEHIFPYKLAAYSKTTNLANKGNNGTFEIDQVSLKETNGEKNTIESVSIDKFVGNKRFDFIKIDVEGTELQCLQGMKETIKRSTNLIMVVEFCKSHHDNYIDLLDIIDKYNLKYLKYNRSHYESLPENFVLNMLLKKD